MIAQLLRAEVQSYIRANVKADVSALALAGNPFPEIPHSRLLDQISGLKKAAEKLPRWHDTEGIVYPSRISMEQASSQHTALYKSGLVSGHSLIDLSGGFGVDDTFFAKSFDKVVHCELNGELSGIVSHNNRVLKIDNVECLHIDGLQALGSREHWDCIYVDPSRRNEHKGKVFLLSDCAPDVPALLPQLQSRSNRILVKASPILDISAAVNQLRNVAHVHIVALDHEVREILFDICGDSQSYSITTVNLGTGQKSWSFNPFDDIISPISQPLAFLYEPNAAIMKSGGFGALARDFGIAKLHRHSHLYTSDQLIEFPGRAFRIEKVVPFSKQGQRELSALKKANVAVRNFPLSVAELRSRLKLADGGDHYCFFTTGPHDQKIVLICSKIGR